MVEEFQYWTDKEIRGLLRRLGRVEYGLLLRFKNHEDLDYFKRKVYKMKVEPGLIKDKVIMRVSPTNPKTELWLLRSTEKEVDNGEREGQPAAEEVHD